MTDYLYACWQVLGELAPWLLLGALVAGLIHAWLPDGFIQRILSGRGGVLSAVAIGVPLPLCSCGVIPAGVGLKEDGASDGATIGFMVSTPQTGVDSIMVSAGFLGLPFALFKVGSAVVTGLVGGWIADAVATGNSTREMASHDAGVRPGLWAGMGHAVDVLRTIWGWLAFGILVSAAITTWIPTESLAAVASWGPLGASLAALALSLPLYVCATASVPIAAAFVAGGLPAGAALVFLMAGPATNVATMGAVYRALGGRMLAVYLGTLIIGSLALGLTFDFVVGPSAVQVSALHAEHGVGLVSASSAVVLLGMFAWFAWETIARRQASQRVSESDDIATTIAVAGMTCGGCTGKLERMLGEHAEVTAASVSLDPGTATVIGAIGDADLRAIVVEAGFTPGPVSRP